MMAVIFNLIKPIRETQNRKRISMKLNNCYDNVNQEVTAQIRFCTICCVYMAGSTPRKLNAANNNMFLTLIVFECGSRTSQCYEMQIYKF